TTGVPHHDPTTMETNVRGVYIAGVLASGLDANKIFIENGRAHGARICEHIKAKPPKVALGGDRLLDIVRPRTRCERDETRARGAQQNAPSSVTWSWGWYNHPAAGQSNCL